MKKRKSRSKDICKKKKKGLRKLRVYNLQKFLKTLGKKPSILFYLGLSALVAITAITALFIFSGKIDKSLIMQPTATKCSQPVAGQPVKCSAFVPVSLIQKNKSFIELPKYAKNIKVNVITQQQAQNIIETLAESNVPLEQKKSFANANQPKRFFAAGLLNSLSKFFLSDLEEAVEQIIPTPDAVVVDLSNETVPEDEIASSPEAPRNDENLSELPSMTGTTSPSDSSVIASDSEAISNDEIASSPEAPRNDENTNDENAVVQVSYETPAPQIAEQNTDTGKIVTVSATGEDPEQPLVDVLAFTNIPKIYKVGQEDKIHIKWKNNGDQNVTFNAKDTDSDGYLDYVEWTVPHLSEQIFEIIFISKAFELDENKEIVADIYDLTNKRDNTWATVLSGHYVRATFEQILDNTKDVTLYAKPTNPANPSTIKVYAQDQLVATFNSINHEGLYKVLLTNLQNPTDVFDLEVTGDIDIDLIIDPSGMLVKYGSFAKPASTTGNQAITGVGFQPKVVMFFGNYLTADGQTTGAQDFFGAATASNSRAVIADAVADGSSTGSKRFSNALVITQITATGTAGSPTLNAEADFVSLDADGFTVNWTTNDAQQRLINYIALAGDDLTNAKVGSFTAPTSASDKAVTGVGFQPDALIFFDNSVTTTPTTAGNTTNPSFNMGFVVGTTKQGNRVLTRASSGANYEWNYQRTNSAQNSVDKTGAVVRTATIKSMDADGFTLTYSVAPANAVYINYIALKGGQYDTGSFDQNTTTQGTGNQAITGVGFQPAGVLFQSDGAVASTSSSAGARYGFGVGVSALQQVSMWSGVGTTTTPPADSDLDSTACLKLWTEGTPTLNSAMSFVSNDADGFTVNNTTVDATSRQVLYFAFGANPVGTPAISSAGNQSFTVGDSATAISTITVTDDASYPTITATNDIRIKIPATFNMTWDETDTTATLGGTASAKASTTVSYEDSNKTLVIDVTSNFSAGETLTVAGLSFKNFSSASSADNLELEVDNSGSSQDTDDKTITVTAQPITVTASTLTPTNFNADTASQYFGTFKFAGTGTITGLVLTEYGTADADVDLSNVKLFQDNGDGVWNSAEDTTQLGSTASFNSSDKATFSNFSLTAGDTTFVHVILNVGAKILPLPAATIGIDVYQSSDVTTTASVTSAGWPLQAGTSTLNTVYPYLQNATTTSIEINWETSSNTQGTVDYGATSSYGTTTSANDDTVVTATTYNFHSVTISGLSANTTYHYRVNWNGATSADNTFKTAPVAGTAFNFIILGDNGGNTDSPATAYWTGASTVCEAIADSAGNPKSIVLDMGDHTDSGANTEWQPQFFLPCRNVLKNTAIYNVYGNHDVGPTTYNNYFAAPTAGNSGTELYYSFNYGNVHFIILDGNQARTSASTQGQWASADLDTVAATGAKWRIVAVHQPPYVYSSKTSDADLDDLVTNVLAPKGVDMVFAGHAHLYQRSFRAEGTKGGITYIVEGRGGATLISPSGSGTYLETSYASDSGYTQVQAGAQRITVTAYDTAGNVVDTAYSPRLPTISSGANQLFTVGADSTTASAITITDDANNPVIRADNTTGDIRIKIPDSLNMIWDSSITSVTVTGTDSAKVSTTLSAYESSNKIAVINVTTNFTAGSTITVSGLKFKTFSSASSAIGLNLMIGGSGGIVTATDDKTIAIGVPPVQIITSVGGDSSAPYVTADNTPVITLDLDKAGDCYASSTNDFSYDEMASNGQTHCDGGGSTSISCQMPELVDAVSQIIYISCQDGSGYKDTSGTNTAVEMQIDTTPQVSEISVDSVSASTVPNVSAVVTIANEGLFEYEYQYEWCVLEKDTDPCNSGAIYYSSSTRNILPNEDYSPTLTATVPSAGQYYFKAVARYGNDQSIEASRQFTAGSTPGGQIQGEQGGPPPTTYTLTYAAGANGTITGTSPQTVNSGSSGTAVTAVANSGYHFVNWSDSSTSNPRTDTNVVANVSVTANFTADAVVSGGGGGGGSYYVTQIVEKVTDLLNLTPEKPKIEYPPIEESVPEKAPVALQGTDILEVKPVKELTLTPIGSNISFFADKIPQFRQTFADSGIGAGAELYLPGFAEFNSQKIPTEVVFVRDIGEMVDYNTAISVDASGQVQQKINTVAGKTMELVIKPDQPAESVTGFMTLYKSSAVKPQNGIFAYLEKFLTASLIDSVKPAKQNSKFTYVEKTPGIYVASISAPENEGQYDVSTIIKYKDINIAPKETKMAVVVNPEGYVYRQMAEGRLRIKGASVLLYWMNSKTSEYEIWPADKFGQKNPIITDDTGRYSFLVPEGIYKIQATAGNYSVFESDPFVMKGDVTVSRNIELFKKAGWFDWIDWQLAVVLLLVLIGFEIIFEIFRKKIKVEQKKNNNK